MNKIKVMNPQLANMIAAGEVVERPSGIVKELIENALDAKARYINIEIIEGGMTRIVVEDDGEGMNEIDLRNALKRHSTSKISQASDLNSILSFGFRGEALPSIGSVSKLTLISHDGKKGHKLEIDNGEEINFLRAPRNKGTTVIVEDLFSKVPARLKYIKNARYETSIVVDLIQKFAISNLGIGFELKVDDRVVFKTFGSQNIGDVYYRVFGKTSAKDAFEIQSSDFDFVISGMFSQPHHTRSHRNNLWIFINQRMIRLLSAQNAIIEAYRRHIPSGRYPIGILNIEVDPQLVDVNVHPSKWEVRLSKEKELTQLIINTLEANLQTKYKAPSIKQEHYVQETLDLDSSRSIEAQFESEQPKMPQESKEVSGLEPLDVLAQMSGKYILAQGVQGLYVIDQHAAMERVRYEYYQKQLLNKVSDKQELLMPIVFDGRQTLANRELEIKEVFDLFDIEIRLFDQDTFVVDAHPTWIEEHELDEFVNKVLDSIEEGRTIREEDFRKNALATLACHSSVRFNEYLSMLEMQALITQLQECEQPFHCPHGRPTLFVIDHDQLWKTFLR